MKRHRVQAGTLLLTLAAVLVPALTAGCANPNARAKQAQRDQRIRSLPQKFVAAEARRPKRLERLGASWRQQETAHAHSLRETLNSMSNRVRQDRQTWQNDTSFWTDWWRTVMTGNSEHIAFFVESVY